MGLNHLLVNPLLRDRLREAQVDVDVRGWEKPSDHAPTWIEFARGRMTVETIRTGGCLCGAVRFTVSGEPYKSGLCHCTDCRRVTGSAFLAYADWRPDQFETTGQVATYHGRSFCPVCGSRLFSRNDHQVEIYLGSLDDAPSGIAPVTEGWIVRREHWQPAISGAGQFDGDPA